MSKNALVLSVGGTPDPLIWCINNLKPDFVYFIHSEKTLKDADTVLKEAEFSGEYKFKLVNNHEDLQESFAKSREVIVELKRKNFDISVDFTGGSKPMVAGLVLAAIGENCKYTYVGTSSELGRDKNGVGIVKSGFETIKDQKDPYDTFAVLEIDRAINFFNTYQFEAAKKNFTNALSKLEDSSLKKQVEFFINIVDFYDTWDKFNNNIEIGIRKNKKNFRLNYHLENNIIKKIDEDLDLSKFFKDENLEFYNQLNCNLDFLDKKISHKNKNIKENINYYLPDLLNNAKRRIEEGKFDDAVARLYRAIELIAQIGLSNCGLIDGEILKNEKKFHLSKKSIYDKSNWELLFLIDSLNLKGWNNISHHTVKTTSKNSYEILKVLGLDFAKDYLNDGDLYNKISKRNNSILAHGLEPINKEIAENIYSLVLRYAKKSWSEIEEYMKHAKFPKFEF